MNDKILLIGGGGHCRSCIDVIESEGRFEIAGVVDNKLIPGSNILGYPVLGPDSKIQDFLEITKNCLITAGQIKSPSIRIQLVDILISFGVCFPRIISPLAHVSRTSHVGNGTIIMHYSLVNSETRIGNHAIINSKALVEHDSIVGSHTHISTGALINGNVSIGNRCFIGSGAILYNGISILDDILIPAGVVVRKSITEKLY